MYLDGYDGHSLRAYFYFNLSEKGITEDVESINSIATLFPKLRQISKAPTFALTYLGTYLTLMKNCGFTEEQARNIEDNYHTMYVESDMWLQNKIKQACIDGYITTGFGLKVRTPMLKVTPYEDISKNTVASAEMRTAGNALGQGWGVLNDRAMNAVISQVDELGLSEDILPLGKIHDSAYYLVRNDTNLLLLLNRLVVKESYWNDHPDIYHPEVSLGGQLDVFYPDWSKPLTLPEDCSESDLERLVEEHLNSLKEQ